MLPLKVILVFYSSIIFVTSDVTTDTSYLIKVDEEILSKLRIPSDHLSKLTSYDDFEVFKDYQCAMECVKDKSHCNGYVFDEKTLICSLFEDLTANVNNDLTKLV